MRTELVSPFPQTLLRTHFGLWTPAAARRSPSPVPTHTLRERELGYKPFTRGTRARMAFPPPAENFGGFPTRVPEGVVPEGVGPRRASSIGGEWRSLQCALPLIGRLLTSRSETNGCRFEGLPFTSQDEESWERPESSQEKRFIAYGRNSGVTGLDSGVNRKQGRDSIARKFWTIPRNLPSRMGTKLNLSRDSC